MCNKYWYWFRHGNNSHAVQCTTSQLSAVPDRPLRVKAFKDSSQWEHFFAQSVVFAHRRWVASRAATGTPTFSPPTTDTHLSVTDVGKQQWATDRRTGTCKHAEHCTLFWHNRNACFPTQALDTKRVLTTVLLHDNREVYVTLHL